MEYVCFVGFIGKVKVDLGVDVFCCMVGDDFISLLCGDFVVVIYMMIED